MAHLALRGGPTTRALPFPAWPVYGESEREGLLRVLESRHWGTLGPETKAFERELADYLGVRHCQTVANGTAALEVALRAIDVGPGDEVIVPPYTFIATATAVLMVGATPVFADVDRSSNALDAKAAARAITPNTKALIPVHIAGRPADMDAIMELSHDRGIPVIEDAAQAHGSRWNGRAVGTIGRAGTFSFQLSKNMSAGEGGAIVTDDDGLAERIWSIQHVGRRRGGLWYGHYEMAGNYRMTDWQAAVLRAQLARLDEQIDVREASAARLDRMLSRIEGIEVLDRDSRATRITHHLYMFRYVDTAFGGVPKDRFVEALCAEGIPASSGYVDIRMQPLFTHPSVTRIAPDLRLADVALPTTEQACRETVWIPQHVLLGSDDDIADVVRAVEKIREHWAELLEE